MPGVSRAPRRPSRNPRAIWQRRAKPLPLIRPAAGVFLANQGLCGSIQTEADRRENFLKFERAFVSSPLTHSAGSCNDGNFVCDSAAGSIGTGSCNGEKACDSAAGAIGNSSCYGLYACRLAASSIGAFSCNGDSACLSADGAIGAGSCYGDSACSNAARAIGVGSCFGTRACNYVFGSIGAGSCSGNLACFWAEGSIGNNSCHTVGTACRGQLTNTFPVGDCQRNDSLFTACVVSRARLPYVSR